MEWLIKIITVSFVAMLTTTAIAQEKVFSVPENATAIYADNLSDFYVTTADNKVIKMRSNGDSVAAFNYNKKAGSVTAVDVTNPFKIVAFYKSFSTIVILDNHLNQKTVIDLSALQILNASAIALSYDNNIWVFDEMSGKIKKIDDRANLISETVDLRTALGTAFKPSSLIDNDGKLYLYDAARGFFVFDYYGGLINQIPLLNWTHIAISQGNIYGLIGNSVTFYSTKTHIQNVLRNITDTGFTDVLIKNKKLWILYPGKLKTLEQNQ